MPVRFPAGANFCSSSTLFGFRPTRSSEEVCCSHITSRRSFPGSGCHVPWKRNPILNGGSFSRSLRKNQNPARAGYSGSASDPIEKNSGEDARLTAAEVTRTIVEVNREASLIFTGLFNDDDEVSPNIVWQDFFYVTDEYGNIYFKVENDEDILQSLTTSENSFLEVIIGFDDTMELMKEAELAGPTAIDFGIENIEDGDVNEEDEDGNEEDDDDDDDDELNTVIRCLSSDRVPVFEDENNHNESDEDNLGLGDWAKLETMRTSHPMYFARRITEVTSNDPVDWMEQPAAGVAIQGLLRPALTEEQSDLWKHISTYRSQIADGDRLEARSSECTSAASMESENDEIFNIETSFYKLRMMKIQLITGDRRQAFVELEDYQRARPDVITRSASNIISRLKAGGEKNVHALRSLCWRCKDIQVEEATLINVDSLGFDVRVCSGTQIQTLRFAFNTRATSEYSAERQLNYLLFPRMKMDTSNAEKGASK